MSPSASVSAFLHSIIGASVLARSSATMLAVIAIMFSVISSIQLKKRGYRSPLLQLGGKSGSVAFFHFHKFVTAFGNGLDHIGHGAGAAFEDRVGDTTGIQDNGLR